MSFYRRLVNPSSGFAHHIHTRRYEWFLKALSVSPTDTIADLGCGDGSHFWNLNQGVNPVTAVDISPQNPQSGRWQRYVQADVRDLSAFDNNEFDIVFCNSLIEHFSTWDDQVQAANEIRRIGRRLWIQTPNLYFPIEPHYGVPFAQWLTNWDERDGIRLLNRKRMQRLFPDCEIGIERLAGMPKSLIAIRA